MLGEVRASTSAAPFAETPKPGDAAFRAPTSVVATAYRSLEAAAEVFRRQGIRPVILGDTITGEAREVGREMAALARAHAIGTPATALISGGECTVTVRGDGGRGGRCSEFLLALGDRAGRHAERLGDRRRHRRHRRLGGQRGRDPRAGQPAAQRPGRAKAMLAQHDSYGFFSALGDLVVTGPTRTNVNDYRAIVIPA